MRTKFELGLLNLYFMSIQLKKKVLRKEKDQREMDLMFQAKFESQRSEIMACYPCVSLWSFLNADIHI